MVHPYQRHSGRRRLDFPRPEGRLMPTVKAKNPSVKYRLVTKSYVKKARFGGKPVLVVDPKALSLLAHEAMRDGSFFLRPKHQQQVAAILKDPEASPNDRFMATALLRNAVGSVKFELPFCPDSSSARG